MYEFLSQCANQHTQRCWPHQKTIADKLECDVRTVRRAVAELLRLNLIAVLKTRRGNVYTLLDVPPERTEMSSGKEGTKSNEDTGVSTPVSSTSANAPVPRAREGASIPEPPPSSPDEPVRASEPSRPAAEPGFSPQNPQTRPRRRWNGRSHSVIRQRTPVQKAAERVMAALGIALSLWKTREAIAHAIRQWAGDNPGQDLEAAVEALVGIRQDFVRTFRAGLLWRDYLVEELSFFQKNFWQDRNSWGWDHKAQCLAREARVGMWDPDGPSWEERCAAEEREAAANKELIDYFRNKEKQS